MVAGDALRALAALGVVAFHAEQGVAYGLGPLARTDPGAVSPIASVLVQGSAGVWIFFALSGYVVGGPWIRCWLSGSRGPKIARYLSRRLRRIVPAFWVVLAVVLIRFGTYDHDPAQILRLFAFAQNTGTGTIDGVLPQGWTLGCEMGFYLALPVVGALAAATGRAPRRAQRRALVLIVVVAVALASLLFQVSDPAGDWSLTLAATAWAFAPGLLLAALEDDLRPRLAGGRAGRAAALLMLVIAVGLVAALSARPTGFAPLVVLYLHATIGASLVTSALLWQWTTGGMPAFARARLIVALGTWSYGIYLVHIAVGRELRRHLPEGLSVDVQLALSLITMGAGSVVAAAVLWWLVEHPSLSRRRPTLSWSALTAPLRA